MKFAVTYVVVSKATARRMGKSRVEVVNTTVDKAFAGCISPMAVEFMFEKTRQHTHGKVKVVDVRELGGEETASGNAT